ncbi:MAG: type II toxin-antitoxin system YafQ family toxin [bacterium]
MKHQVRFTPQFKKDLKRTAAQGEDIEKIKNIIEAIVHNEKLDKSLLDHPLKGQFSDCGECHIENDLLLIYSLEDDIVKCIRTGTHSELFKK